MSSDQGTTPPYSILFSLSAKVMFGGFLSLQFAIPSPCVYIGSKFILGLFVQRAVNVVFPTIVSHICSLQGKCDLCTQMSSYLVPLG